MDYPEIAIQGLINSLDDDQEAYKWLVKSNYKELAALADYICSENPQALQFLLVNKEKFETIINFIAALQKEKKAFDLLFRDQDKKWAAIANAVHGDNEAYEWLVNNNLIIYAKLADTLIDNKPLTLLGKRTFGNVYGINNSNNYS